MNFNNNNIPKNFIWECTRGCNLSCKHCGSSPGDMIEGELTTDEAKNLIDQIADMSFIFLTITGGEPLMRSDIFELINYATMKGISVTLCTNGSLIDKKTADRLFESGLKCASISIDGCKEFHDENRCGTYEKTLSAVDYLKNKAITVFASIMISNENLKMLPEVHRTASDHGIERLDVHIPQEQGRAKENKITLDKDKLIDAIIFANQMEDSKSKVFLDDGFGVYNNRFGCDAARSSMFVSADGVIRPCISFPENFGNIRTEKLTDVWKSPGFEAFRKFDYSRLKEPCKSCDIVESCQGGCRAKVFLRTGEFFAGDEDCDHIKENAPLLFEKASAAAAVMAAGLVLMMPGCIDEQDIEPVKDIIRVKDVKIDYDGSIIKVREMEFFVDKNKSESRCETYYKANITLETNGSVDLNDVSIYYDGFPLDFEIVDTTITKKRTAFFSFIS